MACQWRSYSIGFFIHVVHDDDGQGPFLFDQLESEFPFHRLEHRDAVGISGLRRRASTLRCGRRRRLHDAFGCPADEEIPAARKSCTVNDGVVNVRSRHLLKILREIGHRRVFAGCHRRNIRGRLRSIGIRLAA